MTQQILHSSSQPDGKQNPLLCAVSSELQKKLESHNFDFFLPVYDARRQTVAEYDSLEQQRQRRRIMGLISNAQICERGRTFHWFGVLH